MDRALIERKVESLRRCVRRIEAVRPGRIDILVEDWDTQDILTLNLTRAVQLCVDIAAHVVSQTETRSPETMAAAFDRLHDLGVIPDALAQRLKGAVGFRNVAVHDYSEINWEIVFSVVHHRLDDFRVFGRAVMRYAEMH